MADVSAKELKSFLFFISNIEDLTTYHYKAINAMMYLSYPTQTTLAEFLGISKQNMYKVCKKLIDYGIVYVSKIEGHNKFLAVNTKIRDLPMQGQLTLK